MSGMDHDTFKEAKPSLWLTACNSVLWINYVLRLSGHDTVLEIKDMSCRPCTRLSSGLRAVHRNCRGATGDYQTRLHFYLLASARTGTGTPSPFLVCYGAQARDSIDWTVYVTIAFAFAFSTALENSNVAQGIADIFIDISAPRCPSTLTEPFHPDRTNATVHALIHGMTRVRLVGLTWWAAISVGIFSQTLKSRCISHGRSLFWLSTDHGTDWRVFELRCNHMCAKSWPETLSSTSPRLTKITNLDTGCIAPQPLPPARQHAYLCEVLQAHA